MGAEPQVRTNPGSIGFRGLSEIVRESRVRLRVSSDDQRLLAQIADWAIGYLCRPHADLGRRGDVCPYTRPSIKEELFFVGVLHTEGDLPRAAIVDAMRATRDVFLRLEPTEGSRALLKTMLVALPDVAPEQCADVIESVQRELAMEFVNAGLMLGEFHPCSEAPGIHNPVFRPLRCPVPLLGMRHMVPSDIVFLARSDEQLRGYAARFGEEADRSIEAHLAEHRHRMEPEAVARLERHLGRRRPQGVRSA